MSLREENPFASVRVLLPHVPGGNRLFPQEGGDAAMPDQNRMSLCLET